MKLREHPEIRFPKYCAGGSYSGKFELPNPELSNWSLIGLARIRNKDFVILNVKSKDTGDYTVQKIECYQDILEALDKLLRNQLGKTLWEIGELEVDKKLNILA